MKTKFYFGIMLAIFIGLSVGYVFKVGAIQTYLAIQNFIQENHYSIKNMGGPGAEEGEKVMFEDFPGNGPEFGYTPNVSQEDFAISEQGKTILADLDNMQIKTYQDGKEVGDYSIISKGLKGTIHETPPGKFDIKFKTEKYFSSVSEVWMPYTMQFFGNYFIHGSPYNTDGTPVPENYSGGCIRVSDSQMSEIYAFADIGTTFIVRGKLRADQKIIETGDYEIKEGSKFPRISSKAYMVFDIDSGQVLFENSKDVVFPIASISKLMTALVSLEAINQQKETMASAKAVGTFGRAGKLRTGEIYSIGNLLYPLLLESSNDAAEVIAEFFGRSDFISNMNKKAKSLGLENTSFEDPSGLSPNNKSSAQDLADLIKYIHKNKKYILEISKLKQKELDGKVWYSNSKFRNEKNYLGGKNGYTVEARYTQVVILELPLGQGENKMRNIAIVLLQGGENTLKEVRVIEKYLLSNVYFKESQSPFTI